MAQRTERTVNLADLFEVIVDAAPDRLALIAGDERRTYAELEARAGDLATVEAALKTHPEVFDAVVVGVPDERFGERVAALVVWREGREPDVDALRAHTRTLVAGYKVPKEIHVLDAVQRTPAGKPDYRWAKTRATARSTEVAS